MMAGKSIWDEWDEGIESIRKMERKRVSVVYLVRWRWDDREPTCWEFHGVYPNSTQAEHAAASIKLQWKRRIVETHVVEFFGNPDDIHVRYAP